MTSISSIPCPAGFSSKSLILLTLALGMAVTGRAQTPLDSSGNAVPNSGTAFVFPSTPLSSIPSGEETQFSTSLLASANPTAGLPEAPLPQPQVAVPSKPIGRTASGQPVAPLHDKYIPAGWRAQPLTVHDKVVLGARDLYSFEDIGAIFLSAGYEHVLNSEPNYGTDKGAFGERLGAAAIRESTQGIFTDMVFAPLLHEDSRYYVEGPSHNFFQRTIYAGTRALITRTDSGHETINGALLLGYAGSAALTPAYYPSINRNFHDVAAVYGGGIGGAALGFFVSEFSNDVLQALHLRHNP